MEALRTVAALIGPVFLMLALGMVLRQLKILPPSGWAAVSRLTYLVLIPCLILTNLAPADFAGTPVLQIALVLVGALIIVGGAVWLARPALMRGLAMSGPAYASFFQGTTRFNMFIALPLVIGLYPHDPMAALAAMAVVIGIVPSTVNVMCVVVHVLYADPPDTAKGKRPTVLQGLITNPIILAIIAAVLLNITGIGWPDPFREATSQMAAAVVPLGLLGAGAGLQLKLPDRGWSVVGLAVAIKLVVMPAVTAALALGFGVPDLALVATVVAMATPCAAVSYILAQQMGGDAPMMAAMIAVETLASMLTLSVLLYIMLGFVSR